MNISVDGKSSLFKVRDILHRPNFSIMIRGPVNKLESVINDQPRESFQKGYQTNPNC